MTDPVRAAFFTSNPALIDQVYGGGLREQIESAVTVFHRVVTAAEFDALAHDLAGVEWIFSTWGMPALTGEQIARLPALRAVFYAAGSVQYFARPFLERGVTVVSAWSANAIPVAQVTLAQVLLALKGYFAAERACRTPEGRAAYTNRHPGTYQAVVAILGAGMIGRRVIELLRPHQMQVLVYDPFLSEDAAARLEVRRVSLPDAFAQAAVVSNHIADLPETRGLLARDLFERMPPYATFINTGRGATVDEAGMLDVLARRPDLTALLDVTWPEPPLPESPIYRLENVLLTPHIAGNMGAETRRMAALVIEEWQRWRAGLPLTSAVTLEMLKTMA